MSSFLRFFLLFLLGFIATELTVIVIKAIYSELNRISAVRFPIYSIVTEKDSYMAQELSFNFFAAAISIFIINYIAIAFDNEKMEYIINKTDGFYTVANGARLYFGSYLFCDIAVGITAVVPTLILSTFDLPEKLARLDTYHRIICAIPIAFTDKFGFIPGAVILIALSVISRVAVVFSCLRRWRALWLSDIAD